MLPSENVKVLAVDTETHTPKLKTHGPLGIQHEDYAIGISVAAQDGFNAYYPLRHQEGNGPPDIIPWLKHWMAQPDNLVSFAHAKFDIEMLWTLGIEVKCKSYDVLAIDALINENHGSYSLDSISKRYGLEGKLSKKEGVDRWMLEHGMKRFRHPKEADWGRMREVPPAILSPYAMQDAKLTLDCYECQENLIAMQKLERVAQLECDLIPVTWDMRLEGVPVDLDKAERLELEMRTQGEAWLNDMRSRYPGFEPFASRSLEKYVLTHERYPPRSATGEPSITNEWLEASDVMEFHEVAHYRRAEKLRRDFVSGVVLETAYKGRIHPSWFSTRGSGFMAGDDPNGTRTGRIACETPNLAQIPRRHKILGPKVRGLFVPREGEVWHAADYASQEPRITLHYAVKWGLAGAMDIANRYYADPKTDYHTVVTEMVNRVSVKKIDRDQGKTINLGLVYGLGKAKLAGKLAMSPEETESLLASYHQAVPFVKPLQRLTKDYADKRGYINTELGRRRRFDLWEPAAFGMRKQALPKDEALAAYRNIKRAMTYKALNSAVQGTAAEQIKLAMKMLHAEKLTPLVTMYDELGHSIPRDPAISKRICEIMETAIPLLIPHHVEAKMGDSWAVK